MRRNRGGLLLRNNSQSPLYVVKDVEQLQRSKQHGGILRAARGGGSTKISTLNRGCWVPDSTDKSTRHVSSLFTGEFLSNRCVHFSLTQVFLFVLTATDALGSRTKCAKYLQFPPWLIPNSMRKGVRRGGGWGKGSDLEELLGWTFPSILPSPTSPVLPNQLLLAVRRPPMISSSKADVGLGGLECGMWEAGRVACRGGGEERSPANGFDQNAAWRKA